MLDKKTAEAVYERFLQETNYKRLPKTAAALFTRLERELRSLDETESDGYFPAITAAFFRAVKAVNRNRGLLGDFYALMTDVVKICEKGTPEDLNTLCIIASIRSGRV